MEAARLRMEMICTKNLLFKETSYTIEDEVVLAKIKNNAIILGQVQPIHVLEISYEFYEIIDGNKVAKVFVELGYTHLNCIVHSLSDDRALLLGMVLNLTHQERDFIKVSELINSVESKSDVYNFLPYDSETIKELLHLKTFDWRKYKQDVLNENQISLF